MRIYMPRCHQPCRSIPLSLPKQQRSEEHTSELQSQSNFVCRLLLEKKKTTNSDFRPCLSYCSQSTAIANVTLPTLTPNKIAIKTDVNNDVSVALAQYLKKYYEIHV